MPSLAGQPAAAGGALDSDRMFAATAALPEQLRDAAEAARQVDTGPLRNGPGTRSIAVLGMGGSGVAGAVLEAFGADRLPVPVGLVNDYRLPRWVGPGTLCFAVSCSGNTEETLAAAEEAVERGATLVTVSTGGSLEALAVETGSVHYRVPGDIVWPRAAIGALSAPLLVACERAGLLEGASAEIAKAVDQLSLRRDALVVAGGGVAAALAARIGSTIPLVYGAAPCGAVAARRWKTQVNENPKAPAFSAVQPELCHNEVCGWGVGGDVTRQVVTIVDLRSDHDHPRVKRRFELVDEIVREAVAGIEVVHAEGEGVLAQMMDLVIVGDFVSLHMAAAFGVDPGPIPVLMDLKEKLASE